MATQTESLQKIVENLGAKELPGTDTELLAMIAEMISNINTSPAPPVEKFTFPMKFVDVLTGIDEHGASFLHTGTLELLPSSAKTFYDTLTDVTPARGVLVLGDTEDNSCIINLNTELKQSEKKLATDFIKDMVSDNKIDVAELFVFENGGYEVIGHMTISTTNTVFDTTFDNTLAISSPDFYSDNLSKLPNHTIASIYDIVVVFSPLGTVNAMDYDLTNSMNLKN